MKIRIQEIARHKQGLKFDYREDLTHLTKEIKQLMEISPVDLEGRAEKIGELYVITGSISTNLKLQCSRCLEDFNFDLDNKFEEIFLPKDTITDYDLEKDNIRKLETDEIDLKEITEEIIIINIPYAPVCQEECKGLCPNCGVNLNDETCDCNTEQIDPRMADLAKWFDQNNSTK